MEIDRHSTPDQDRPALRRTQRDWLDRLSVPLGIVIAIAGLILLYLSLGDRFAL